MEQIFTGVIEDPRTEKQKEKDWSADEVLAASALLDWRSKTESELKQFPIWNQYKTGACVAFSKARQIAIWIWKLTGVWIDLSPASIYQLRANAPGQGMYVANANDIVDKSGVSLEALMKSQNLTEEQINAVKRTKIADLFAKAVAEAVQGYFYLSINIDRIAQALEQGNAVSLLIFAEADEYDQEEPTIKHPDLSYFQASIKHEITATDYFLENGVKKLWSDDSWGLGHGKGGRRKITEEWLLKRCIMADYFDQFSLDPQGLEKPKHTFNVRLKYGQRSDEIKSLQDCLKYEGLFPTDKDSTGYYGEITRRAVYNFQKKYEVAGQVELDQLQGREVGQKTIKKLNEIYS